MRKDNSATSQHPKNEVVHSVHLIDGAGSHGAEEQDAGEEHKLAGLVRIEGHVQVVEQAHVSDPEWANHVVDDGPSEFCRQKHHQQDDEPEQVCQRKEQSLVLTRGQRIVVGGQVPIASTLRHQQEAVEAKDDFATPIDSEGRRHLLHAMLFEFVRKIGILNLEHAVHLLIPVR